MEQPVTRDTGVPRKSKVQRLLVILALMGFSASAAATEGCPTSKDEIATDRPDVTNSSLVVPTGSFQSENGINLSRRDGATYFDGTNSRLRLGVAPVSKSWSICRIISRSLAERAPPGLPT